MNVNGIPYRTIWVKKDDARTVQVIDQRWLPHRFVVEDLKTLDDVVVAIKEMHVRGAPLIGVAAAFGICLAILKGSSDKDLKEAAAQLKATRPTAVNLSWALEKELDAIHQCHLTEQKAEVALQTAQMIADEDVETCKAIGKHGLNIIKEICKKKKANKINILTHCNAGWLACVDWGTATSPIYQAFNEGIEVHVWVDETRPRNQGASLTAWELAQHGVPHTVIADNSAGHLMQRGKVDLVIVGSDRTTVTGDVANKIGTYSVALAAKDNAVPFYVALPSTTIDWALTDGVKQIPIEERSPREVTHIRGLVEGEIKEVLLTPAQTPAINYAFDVTPRRLVTGLITERGVSPASREGLLALFPEKAKVHV